MEHILSGDEVGIKVKYLTNLYLLITRIFTIVTPDVRGVPKDSHRGHFRTCCHVAENVTLCSCRCHFQQEVKDRFPVLASRST